jgi:hypothetical protein
MANSGIHWIDVTFNFCVRLLYQVAEIMGITYEEINVWLFVVIGPILMVFSFAFNIYLILRLKQEIPRALEYGKSRQISLSKN